MSTHSWINIEQLNIKYLWIWCLAVILSERVPNVEYLTRHYNILLGARESKDLYFCKIG